MKRGLRKGTTFNQTGDATFGPTGRIPAWRSSRPWNAGTGLQPATTLEQQPDLIFIHARRREPDRLALKISGREWSARCGRFRPAGRGATVRAAGICAPAEGSAQGKCPTPIFRRLREDRVSKGEPHAPAPWKWQLRGAPFRDRCGWVGVRTREFWHPCEEPRLQAAATLPRLSLSIYIRDF